MKVCVLQPDYSQSTLDYKNIDQPRDLSHLLPENQLDHIFLQKTIIYRQLKELKKQRYDIFVNLCEGYRDWDVSSIHDVTTALEELNLPYTGPTSTLYDLPKELMKYVAYCQGVGTPAFVIAESLADVDKACDDLKFPLFVRPTATGDSLLTDKQFYVTTKQELLSKAADIIANFDRVMIEEYVDGREFTVLVVANPDDARSPIVYRPIEFVFSEKESFKTYDLKIRQHHSGRYIPCSDNQLDLRLRDVAKELFLGFETTVGYARLDCRVNEKGEIFFLEINFPCSVFSPEGSEDAVDYILKFDDGGHGAFLQHIITEGIARYQRQQKKYKMWGSPICGYGIYAAKDLKTGEIVIQKEEKALKIVTRSYVQSHWSATEQEVFQRYAYPLSEEIFMLWDSNPTEWAPINHSCDPNTAFQGLNIYAIRDIAVGEELTFDYSTMYNENMLEFQCQCHSPKCRKIIRGVPLNSVTLHEQKLNKSNLLDNIS
ncbi:MAG: SET domain-containing protein-lysine N-methyltransferase [Brasilonema angustatum HA4187-MV1]|jgi:D-alanine-D-alanine ligase|nr:SET domain-containing protein-lysine N-methyltransferase [Brasilonema angustatum HA4187-MV1]